MKSYGCYLGWLSIFLLNVFSANVHADTLCSSFSSTSSSGTLTDAGGSAGNYANSQDCRFLIQPDDAAEITLSFSSFSYESGFDYLYIFDGSSTGGTFLGRFTGSSIPASLTATSGAMYIVHISDSIITAAGFEATWSAGGGLPSGLVAQWHFDEGQWDGSDREVVDNVANLNGVAVNGANTVSGGQVCRAASFDGVDDYLSVEGIDSYLNTTSSLSFWMKTSQSSNSVYWSSPGITGIEEENRSSNDIFWGYITNGGHIALGKGGSHHVQSTSTVNDGAWRHVVLTRDSASGELNIYINGVLNISFAGRTGDASISFSSLGRIEDTGGTPEYFSGELDEVLVFDSVISAADVLSIYNNQLAGNNWDGSARHCDPAPIAQWHLDGDGWDGTSDEVIDSGGNEYHGRVLYSVVSPEDGSPAIASSGGEGTCSYGSFSSGSIAIEGLPVSTNTGDKTTVTFWMRWDGTSGSMPIGWSFYDLWFSNGSFGFNTWNNDIYGISSSSLSGGWHHISAEFTNGSNVVTSNRLWVDGVEQNLTQRVGSPSSNTRSVGSSLRLGGAENSSFYRFHGDLDEVRVYSQTLVTSQVVNIMSETHPCGDVESATYFSISHDNNASYCLNESLIVSARDADTGVVSAYSGTVTLNTQTGAGGWSLVSGTGSLVDANTSDGLAFYTFDEADNGVASFSLYYPSGANIVDVDVYDESARDDDSEGNLVFSATGFSVTASTLPNPPSAPINDPISAQVAGQAFQIAVAAYGIDSDSGECGIIETYVGNKNITLSTTYNNPTSGTLAASGTGVVSFSSGQALINTQYNDVGSITISVNDSSENVSGQSNDFVVKPDDFSIVVEDNPATTSSGSGFIAAGEAFSVTIQALNAQGDPTPNYGNELTPESVTVAIDSLAFPVGGDLGTLSNGDSFSKVAANSFKNTSVSWNEVGSLRLAGAIADGDYLGAGNVTGEASGTIGRFYPDSFYLGSESVSNSCSRFTYLSQPDLSVRYTLSAIASDGSNVTNYDAGLAYPVGTIDYHGELNNDGSDLGSRLSTDSTTWSAGDYSLVDEQAIFARTTSREAPLENVVLGISVNDIDGRVMSVANMNASTSDDCTSTNSCTQASLGDASFYYGRIILPDAYGPETAALPAKLVTQYWDGTAFISNVYDNCTVLPRSVVSFNGSAITGASDLLVNLSGGTTEAQFTALDSNNIGFTNGDAGLYFLAPGLGITIKSFIVDIDLNDIDWLRSDWGQDDNDNNDTSVPTATMSFKTYRGHDRVLYWRHKY